MTGDSFFSFFFISIFSYSLPSFLDRIVAMNVMTVENNLLVSVSERGWLVVHDLLRLKQISRQLVLPTNTTIKNVYSMLMLKDSQFILLGCDNAVVLVERKIIVDKQLLLPF
jgi:hypothetical protein